MACLAVAALNACGRGRGGLLLGFLKIVMAPLGAFGIISGLRSRDFRFYGARFGALFTIDLILMNGKGKQCLNSKM